MNNEPVLNADPWRLMPAVVTEIRDETPGVKTYRIALQDDQDAKAFTLKAGQFNMLYLPGVGESAISVSGDPSKSDPLIHTVRAVGNVTDGLAQSKIGSTLAVRGPFGSHWPIESCHGRDVVLVAGGIGVAPIRPAIYSIMNDRATFGDVTVLIGARTPADLLYADEYDSWRAADIEVQTTVDRADAPWDGDIGFVTLLLQRLALPRPDETVLMACGPELMMIYIVQTALERGLNATSTYVSLERNMKCAIGHCGHCQFGPHFICKDGPVLRYDRVESLMRIESL